MAAHLVNILEIIALYILQRWILWYMNYTAKKEYVSVSHLCQEMQGTPRYGDSLRNRIWQTMETIKRII
jgi:hypothetical protein